MTAIAVTIAGSDSSGGAGIQADLKTFSALGVYGASVIAALTAQNTTGVTAIHDVPPEFVTAQIDAVFSDLKVAAVKIGMLSTPPVIEAVAVLKRVLLPRALIVTPNLPEAAALLDTAVARSEAEMREQAERLLALGVKAVLLKGGHGTGPESADIFADGTRMSRLTAERVATRNTHGTGCTLSSAIAAGLAKGLDLAAAVREAKAYITAAIGAADRLAIGSGHGPVHHFHAWW
jgi:hydroxymethylpyrimidine/phosphomethylpyrimidine kinase